MPHERGRRGVGPARPAIPAGRAGGAGRARRGGTVSAMDIGAPELLIVLAIALVLFGGAKLPQLARSIGQAQKEFRKASHEDEATGTDKPAS